MRRPFGSNKLEKTRYLNNNRVYRKALNPEDTSF